MFNYYFGTTFWNNSFSYFYRLYSLYLSLSFYCFCLIKREKKIYFKGCHKIIIQISLFKKPWLLIFLKGSKLTKLYFCTLLVQLVRNWLILTKIWVYLMMSKLGFRWWVIIKYLCKSILSFKLCLVQFSLLYDLLATYGD